MAVGFRDEWEEHQTVLIDWLVIAAYLVGVALIGLYSARKVKTSLNFFISDRNFGKLLMTFFTFGTGTNTDQAVTVASKTYTDGPSGICRLRETV